MKKLSISIMLAAIALFSLSIAAMAVEVEQRVYVEFSSASEFSDEYDYIIDGQHYKDEHKDDLDEGITFGYEAAFATSNKSLKVLAGGNFSIGGEMPPHSEESEGIRDVNVFNVYSGVKYQIAGNKIKPYLVGRLGLGMMDIEANWFDRGDLDLYAGVGIGIKPIEKMSMELMYLYNKNEYDTSTGDSENGKIIYKRWALSVGYLF